MKRLLCLCSPASRQISWKMSSFPSSRNRKKGGANRLFRQETARSIFPQCRGDSQPPSGVVMPTFMPEIGLKYLFIFCTSPGYQTNRAFPCQKEPRSHRVQEIHRDPRFHNPGIQSGTHGKQCPAVLRFLEPAKFLIS